MNASGMNQNVLIGLAVLAVIALAAAAYVRIFRPEALRPGNKKDEGDK